MIGFVGVGVICTLNNKESRYCSAPVPFQYYGGEAHRFQKVKKFSPLKRLKKKKKEFISYWIQKNRSTIQEESKERDVTVVKQSI